MIFDYTLKNRRIKLVHTDDKYTRLRTGAMGTIRHTFQNLDKTCISIIWDADKDERSSYLSLIEGIDEYEII